LLKEGAPKEETPSPSTSGTAPADSIEAAASIAAAAAAKITSRTTPELDPKVSKAIEDATEALLLGDDQAKMWIGTQVGAEQWSFIATAKTAYGQWGALKRVYEPMGNAQLGSLLAAFHGYNLRPGQKVEKVASDLTTMQTDIRMINPSEAPTESAKLIRLTEMLLKSNFRYENTVLMLRSRDYVTFEEAVLQLKQAEERIATSDEAAALMNVALVAHGTSNPFGENSKKDAGKPRGKPTGGDRECWHYGSQDHIRTSCSNWLETPEGTKWAAKNPSKASKVPKEEKEKEKAQLFLAGLDLGPKSST
jgi:hypothetical protein